jgi:hypothetical protein
MIAVFDFEVYSSATAVFLCGLDFIFAFVLWFAFRL